MHTQFASFAEFVVMGGHAGFVFGAWGLGVGVIAALIVRAWLNGARQKARVAAFESDTLP